MKRKDALADLHRIWPQLTPLQKKWLRVQAEIAYGIFKLAKVRSRPDLWLFPPLVFFGIFMAMSRLIRPHRLDLPVVVATAFNAVILTLLIVGIGSKRTRH